MRAYTCSLPCQLIACFVWIVTGGVALELQGQTNSDPIAPPAAPAQRSAAELEKLVASIALYPDPLLATMLPASVYPLEIVQAARFVSDTNNLAKLDAQPWDDSVKAVARVPDAIKKLNEDIAWTIELGDAFLAQDKDIMDAIQAMRGKAQKAGTLRTTPQQVIVVTNMVVEKTVEQQVVVVTNTVVQIQPSSSSVVYVPTYNPTTVYYPPPAYVYDPIAPLVTFTAGVAMGAIIANNCNWYGGGCYHGDVDVDIDKNVNRNVNRNGSAGARPSTTGTQKKWQPDQSRLNKSGAPSASTRDARGWGGGSTQAGQRPTASTGARGSQFGSGSGGGARPSSQPTHNFSQAPKTANQPSRSGGASTPAQRPASPSAGSRPATSPSGNRSSQFSGAGQNQSFDRSSTQRSSAFNGVSSGSTARSASSRGAASRGGGGGGGGGRRR